jgi:cell division transport system permease protein
MRLVLRETMLAFRRAPLLSLLSVSTIAFSLFVFGLFGLVAVNIQAAIGTAAERVEVVAYLRRGTAIEAITLGMNDILAFPEVQSVEHVSETEALSRARRELPEFQDIFQDLEVNPLPASLEVRLKPQFRTAATAAAVAERLKGFQFVEDVRFGNDWVEKLDRLRAIATAAGLVIGAAFALVAIIIIGNTIRMAVLHRGREIAIMRLVGATDGFIRRPFLLEGFTKGVLGGLLALALCYGTFSLVGSVYHATVFFVPAASVAGVAAGGLLGLVGSLVAVGRHLRGV